MMVSELKMMVRLAMVVLVKPEPLLLLFLQCHTQSQVDYRLHLDLGISELIAMTDFRIN